MAACCVLAVDTTSMKGSAALFRDGSLLAERRWVAEESHSTRLLSEIEATLDAANGDLRTLTHLAAICGPGSFTGIRIGLGTIQGLSQAGATPILSLTALEVLAFAAPAAPGPIQAVIDARRNQVFHQTFEFFQGRMPEARSPALCQDAEGWIAGLGNSEQRLIGSGAAMHRSRIEELPGHLQVLPDVDWLAGYGAELAAIKITKGIDRGGPGIDALYIRPPDIRAPGNR